MAEIFINDPMVKLLDRFISVQSRRTQLISGNIANIDTPGFTAKDLDFQNCLNISTQEAVQHWQPTNETIEPTTILRANSAVGIDGNNVDMAQEMSELASTGIQYLFGTQMLQARFRILKMAIREGR